MNSSDPPGAKRIGILARFFRKAPSIPGGAKCDQQRRLERAWQRISGRKELPERLNPSVLSHLHLVDVLRSSYGNTLEDPGDFAGLMFQPEFMLEFPKDWTRRALVCMLDCANGQAVPGFDFTGNPAAIDTIQFCLDHLEEFVDVSRESLPLDPIENARFGLALQHGASVEDALKRNEELRRLTQRPPPLET